MIKRLLSRILFAMRKKVPFSRLGALGAAIVLCGTLTLQTIQARNASAAEVTQSAGVLNTVTPQRVLDTRTTTGGHDSVLGSGATMQLPVLGNGGVPGAGVSAVLVNVTAVNETASSGYLTLFQTGVARPTSSTVNYVANTPIANEAMVRVGSNGTISIYNSIDQTNVIVDVEGWVGVSGSAGNGTVTTATPSRVLDTRTTTGGHNAPLAAGQHISVPIEGAGSVPTAGVSSVLADVIAVPSATAGGYLTAYSSDAASVPVASSVNAAAGTPTSTLTWIPVGADGHINLYSSTANMNAVVDVFGWMSGGDVTTDAGVQVVPPSRILDTRTTTGGQEGAMSANETLNVHVQGVGGIPSSGVAGVIAHVTAVAPAASTYFNVFPYGYPESTALPPGDAQMTSSALNVNAKAVASNTVVLPIGANGDISIHNYTSNPNVVVDIQGWIAAPVLSVTPPSAAALNAGGTLTTTDGQTAQKILNNANLYAMTTWWNTVAPTLLAAPMTNATAFEPNGTVTTDVIRRLSSEAYSLATAISTGSYDPTVTGVSTAAATARVAQIISTVAAGHLVNTPGGWGANWQSMFWAGYLGTAAWMIWPQLTPQVQAEVAKVVYFEANWGAGYPLIFYANGAGTVISAGNTGADNDSWQSMAAQIAVAMMPTNAMVPMWQNTIVRDGLDAWARPSDDSSSAVENGASVASWLNNQGSNVLSTGDLYNHGRFAADYSALIYQNMQDILVNSLAGQSTPQAVTSLLSPVYAAYTSVNYTDPPYDSPGGTVYTPGSAAIYYPQGCDWGTGQEIPYALVDAETAAFGVGTATSATYESLHANAELALQNAHTDGHTYDSNTQFNYTGREENVAQEAAQLYLTKYVRDHSLASFNNTSYWLAP
ncbi:MAG TPA: hypothetical protein VIM53_00940 [Candidatus Saccharimonadales bacterium]